MDAEVLPTRSIRINASDFQEIQGNAWGRSFKPAQLQMEGQTYSAEFGLRGGHTRNYSKKSYEVRLDDGKNNNNNNKNENKSDGKNNNKNNKTQGNRSGGRSNANANAAAVKTIRSSVKKG